MKRFVLLAVLLTAAMAAGIQLSKAENVKMTSSDKKAEAIFAGGCFWCMESELKNIAGVTSVESGYTGGHVKNPTYEQVSQGRTGHYEAVRITYDPTKTSYEKLLPYFWSNIDPFDEEGQFCDKGTQYKAVIFYHNEAEKQQAEQSKQVKEKRFGKPVATLLLPTAVFYPAEDYHQDYSEKNPNRYKMYKWGCGRDKRLNEVWGEDRNEDPPFNYYKDK